MIFPDQLSCSAQWALLRGVTWCPDILRISILRITPSISTVQLECELSKFSPAKNPSIATHHPQGGELFWRRSSNSSWRMLRPLGYGFREQLLFFHFMLGYVQAPNALCSFTSSSPFHLLLLLPAMSFPPLFIWPSLIHPFKLAWVWPLPQICHGYPPKPDRNPTFMSPQICLLQLLFYLSHHDKLLGLEGVTYSLLYS